MKFDKEMGFMYLAENTGEMESKNVEVHDKYGVFYVEFDACYHSFDVINRNNRKYKKANVLSNIFGNERIQTYFKNGGWYGEQNHPIPKYADKPLSPERIRDIDMNNTSHRALKVWEKGNLLMARVQSDSGTDAGMNLARKMVQGFNPAYSCRSIATLVMENGEPVVDVKQIIAYDWVLFQSHREAEIDRFKSPEFIQKSKKIINEFTESVKNGYNDIMIPLKDILISVGKTNINAQVIMESFDLSYNDIVGITPNNKYLIIKDNMNTIYCNTDLKDRKLINEYLSSFK